MQRYKINKKIIIGSLLTQRKLSSLSLYNQPVEHDPCKQEWRQRATLHDYIAFCSSKRFAHVTLAKIVAFAEGVRELIKDVAIVYSMSWLLHTMLFSHSISAHPQLFCVSRHNYTIN